MTAKEFVAICEEHCVAPAIALENTEVARALLGAKDPELVSKALRENF